MTRFTRGQRGFTLFEVLIAVAILAILATIAVPVVVHLRGGAEIDAGTAELSNVQAAIDALMVDQGLSLLPNPITVPTSNMGRFPDWESDVVGGYVLFAGIVKKNSNDYKYIAGNTTGTYICASDGTVEQVATGY